ncbi:MAG TPA: hypothetical protein VHW44_10130 [Pseudonocardiaceae bacterium]|nr:hypothetical protein [Pseudonocardiaceae bacterium]
MSYPSGGSYQDRGSYPGSHQGGGSYPGGSSYPGGRPTGGFTGQPYGGLGAFGPPPEPPRRRRGLLIGLCVGAVLVIAGAAVTVLLLRQHSTSAPAATAGTTTSAPPANTANWVRITNGAAGVSYQVPPSWVVDPSSESDESAGLNVSGFAEAYPFTCQDNSMLRAQIMSGATGSTSAAAVANQVATAMAQVSYRVNGTAPTLDPPSVQPAIRGGADGVLVTVGVHTAGGNPCYATKAQVTALALPRTGRGVAVVVLNVATDGPHADKGPTSAQVTAILASVRIATG